MLIVEDDAFDRRALRRTLARAEPSAELDEACDGHSGLQAWRGGGYDVVFLDVNLPDLDGSAVLRTMIAEDPQATVVAITGQDDRDLAVRMIEAGAVDFLEKGNLDETLLARTLDFAEVRRRAEAKFRLLVIRHHTPIVVLRDDGGVRFANPAAHVFFGWPQGQPLPPTRLELPPPGELLVWSPANGPTRRAEVHEQSVEWEGETCRLLSLRDRTALHQANEKLRDAVRRLERSNSRLEQFASTLSHDLREPLRAINSFSRILAQRYLTEEDHEGREMFGFVLDGGERMASLIAAVLEFARSGAEQLQLTEVDAGAVVEDVLLELDALIEDRGAVVEVGELPTVVADRSALARIFQNLIGNALKYADAGTPRVRIDGGRGGDGTATFTVADRGIGIASEQHERIFDPFVRLHRGDEIAGTGLGLEICRSLVEQMGGTIGVESRPGEGSTFSFTLPPNEPTD
ncbi:MAG: hybrid sensor histidine kinase/response regulator [Acidobacteria bacterium]|nr:MAG: hybrid sensor histidine kinase/response regulator [Acidobacteriota bacterium]REK07821.1 MAG: hybrid sensor histidine kinase/response regulator [Acidobacteriota bacterium]